MTNEEAKTEIMQIYGSLSEEKKMALDVLMAQEDGEHDGCKDCVYQANPQDAMPCRECKQNYMDKWKAIPSAEPQTGHWEWVQYDSNPNIGNWHCSECRTIIPHMPKETDNTPSYKWCPICGSYNGGDNNGNE